MKKQQKRGRRKKSDADVKETKKQEPKGARRKTPKSPRKAPTPKTKVKSTKTEEKTLLDEDFQRQKSPKAKKQKKLPDETIKEAPKAKRKPRKSSPKKPRESPKKPVKPVSTRNGWGRLDRWLTILVVFLAFSFVLSVVGLNHWTRKHGVRDIHPLEVTALQARAQAFAMFAKEEWGPPKSRSASLGFEREIHAAALRSQLKPALLKSLIRVESKFENFLVSRQGAIGLLQLKADLLKVVNLDGNLFEPMANLKVGAAFLAMSRKLYRSPKKVILAFHRKELKNPMLPASEKEAQYVQKVIDEMAFFQKDPGQEIRIASKRRRIRIKKEAKERKHRKSFLQRTGLFK